MDKTLNKLIMVLVGVLIFDTISFNLTLEKTQFNIVSSLINTGKKVSSIVSMVK